MLFYRAAVDLSHQTLNYVAGVVRRHRKSMRSVWRRLNPGRKALLVLVYLCKGETFTEIGAGFGVSTSTAWRYVEETVALLSARSPKLGQALRKAKRDGLHYLVLDGTLIHTDRVKADRPYFSGKHRVHGMSVQVIASPDGPILWTSGALPGKAHDLSAARIWGILRALEQAGIITPRPGRFPGLGCELFPAYGSDVAAPLLRRGDDEGLAGPARVGEARAAEVPCRARPGLPCRRFWVHDGSIYGIVTDVTVQPGRPTPGLLRLQPRENTRRPAQSRARSTWPGASTPCWRCAGRAAASRPRRRSRRSPNPGGPVDHQAQTAPTRSRRRPRPASTVITRSTHHQVCGRLLAATSANPDR
jgi:hypothetical protein